MPDKPSLPPDWMKSIQLVQPLRQIPVDPKLELERRNQKTLCAIYQFQEKEAAEKSEQNKRRQAMIEIQKQIIQAVLDALKSGANNLTDEQLSHLLGLDLHEVRYCLTSLSDANCIKLHRAGYSDGRESWLVSKVESTGIMFLKGKISINDAGVVPSVSIIGSYNTGSYNNVKNNSSINIGSTAGIEKSQIRELLSEIEKVSSQLNLSEELETDLKSDVATAQAQLDNSKPKLLILKTALEGVQGVFKGALEKAVATEIAAELLHPLIEKIGSIISQLG